MKSETVLSLLKTGWVPVEELLTFTGWKAPTLRGFLSHQNRNGGVTIERKRENGVTSYRATESPSHARPG